MKRHIQFPKIEGNTSRQAHCALPEKTFEREFGREGFFGPCSHLYHANNPMGWVKWEGPLRPRAFDTVKFTATEHSPHAAKLLFRNASVSIRFWHTSGKMDHLVTNADGDDLLFVHAGAGSLFCDFGHLTFREGDYITLPRGAKWRVECEGVAKFLLIEATGSGYDLPDKGLAGPHAIFDPAMLDVPQIDEAFKAQWGAQEWKVLIKRKDTLTTVTFPFNPLDVVGWKGDLCPVRINWRNLRPLMSHRYHLPPSAHTTFLANRFVVCTFVPRPMETDPDALKLPFFHSNNDFDEIIFYHRGQFFSRDNIHPGMMTLHPMGFSHGPHPKAFKLATAAVTHERKETDEVAVMVDTRDAVDVTPDAETIEWTGYVDSWR